MDINYFYTSEYSTVAFAAQVWIQSTCVLDFDAAAALCGVNKQGVAGMPSHVASQGDTTHVKAEFLRRAPKRITQYCQLLLHSHSGLNPRAHICVVLLCFLLL